MVMTGERIKMETMESIRDYLGRALQHQKRKLWIDDYVIRLLNPRQVAGLVLRTLTKYARTHAAANKKGIKVNVTTTPEVQVDEKIAKFTQSVVNEISKNTVSGDFTNFNPSMIDFNAIAKIILLSAERANKGGLFDHVHRSEIVTEMAAKWVSRYKTNTTIVEAELESNIMFMLLESGQEQFFEVFDPMRMLGLNSPLISDRIEARLGDENEGSSTEGYRGRID